MERFHQTLKKYIPQQDGIEARKQLQAQLDRFATYYNEVRPHRAIERKTPQEVYAARGKAGPSSEPIDLSGGRKLRHDKLDSKGTVTLRINGQMHHIPCGRAYAGSGVRVLVDNLDIRVIGVDGSPLRHLTLDPTRNYQPLGRLSLRVSTMTRDICLDVLLHRSVGGPKRTAFEPVDTRFDR